MDYTIRWADMAESRSTGLRSLLRSGAISTLALATRPRAEPTLRVLYCHYVFDDQVASFERMIEYLSNIGDFLSADGVLAVVKGAKKLEKRSFHLAFDDGFRNILVNAWPVLRRNDIPATFFVPSSIVSADERTITDYCLNITNHSDVIEMATWDDLAIAQEEGLTIASHTRTHARFREISGSSARLEDELFGSKADIEQKLGSPCRYISWPYGRITDADEASLQCVQRAGYDACFGAFRGRIEPGSTNPFYIPRHHFEPQWPLAHLKYFANGGMEGK